jgi:hypothetical protein
MKLAHSNLPALIPVRVPWQISASAAFLRPESPNVQVGQPTHIDFVGFFGSQERGEKGYSGEQVVVVQEPEPFRENHDGPKSAYQLVRVKFDCSYVLRVCPGLSESRVIDPSLYDWDKVTGRLLPGETTDECVRRIRADWLSTGVCPNPRMYEVSPSSWLKQLNLTGGDDLWKHYLLAGSDDYVEVIAQNWTWLLGQAVS